MKDTNTLTMPSYFDNNVLTPDQFGDINHHIRQEIQNVETLYELSIVFKNQKPIQQKYGKDGDKPFSVIPASILKMNMPSDSVICWADNGLPVWRFQKNHDVRSWKSNRIIEISLCNEGLTYIRGDSIGFPIGLPIFRVIDDCINATKRVFNHVYGMNL